MRSVLEELKPQEIREAITSPDMSVAMMITQHQDGVSMTYITNDGFPKMLKLGHIPFGPRVYTPRVIDIGAFYNSVYKVVNVHIDYLTRVKILLSREGSVDVPKDELVDAVLATLDDDIKYMIKYPYDLYVWLLVNLFMLGNEDGKDTVDLGGQIGSEFSYKYLAHMKYYEKLLKEELTRAVREL